jgi:hypothetical protein
MTEMDMRTGVNSQYGICFFGVWSRVVAARPHSNPALEATDTTFLRWLDGFE